MKRQFPRNVNITAQTLRRWRHSFRRLIQGTLNAVDLGPFFECLSWIMAVQLGLVYILTHSSPRSCTEICVLSSWRLDVKSESVTSDRAKSNEIARVLLQAQLSIYCIFRFVTFLTIKHFQGIIKILIRRFNYNSECLTRTEIVSKNRVTVRHCKKTRG